MNIKDLTPGSYTVVQPKKMNIKDLTPGSYTVVDSSTPAPVVPPTPTPTPDTGSVFTSGPIGSLPVVKQLNQFGVGLGTEIGKAGLGLGQTLLKGSQYVSNKVLGTPKDVYDPLIKNIEETKKGVYEDPYKKDIASIPGGAGKLVGVAAPYFAGSGAITTAQAGLTGLVSKIPAVTKTAKLLTGALGVAGRATAEGLGTAAMTYGLTGGNAEEAKTAGEWAFGLSSLFGSVGALHRGAKETGLYKNVLSKTTGIAEKAFDDVSGGINNSATPESALNTARKSIYDLRTKITKTWQDGLPKIADEFEKTRSGLTDSQVKRYSQVVDEFGVDPDTIPQNLRNMSAVESINLMKGLNELDSLAVKMSSRGAIVRQLKNELRSSVKSAFGGETGSVATLWKDYSIKSQILKNADAIVQAYKTNPVSTVTAKNRLMAIYDANKPEFLKAIKDLEGELGVNITGDVASTKFQKILPEGILKADGGLPTKMGVVDKLIKALLLPLTSPKIAGKLATPTAGEAGIIGKRVLGDYRSRPVSEAISDTAQNITPIKNIPQTINNGANNINKNIISPSVSQVVPKVKLPKKGIIQRIKDTPNKQGGFARLPFTDGKVSPTATKVAGSLKDELNGFIKTTGDQFDNGELFDMAGKLDNPTPSVIKQAQDMVDAYTERASPKVTKLQVKSASLPKNVEPLAQEAKKYKSAEEFVKAQGTPIYHGSNEKINVFSNKKGAQGVIWFTDNPKAIMAGESGAQGVKHINERITTGQKFAGWNEYEKLGLGQIKDMGFDGIKLPTKMQDGTLYNDYILFDSKTIKNKSQLTDIWNKANNK